MRGKWDHFIAGIFTCSALTSLYQDWLGMNEYLERVKNGWTSYKITVPVALIMLLWAVVAMRRGER